MVVQRYTFDSPQLYQDAVEAMEATVEDIHKGLVPETIWFLEHPSTYTAGPLVASLPEHVPVIRTKRGGQLTYHGPFRRIGYVMVDLKKRGLSISDFVFQIEQWLIHALADVGIGAFRLPAHTGIWTEKGKIASVGIYVRSGITSHGFALNVATDVTPFQKIIPCGLENVAMTSVVSFFPKVSMEDMDKALWRNCPFQ